MSISFDKFDLHYSAGGGFENSLCGVKAVLLWNFKFQGPEWVRFWMLELEILLVKKLYYSSVPQHTIFKPSAGTV